ncbi:uracil-DNA glycosylase family protein [Sphingomonas profundi]|uniref:uracil-DNA glycosylase family protein n=1 Tax=Alterirhizorhabdus profundi TaxID=2681549 RepID=UPI001E40147A|nr:uracil-DNA glycosylase family protein [Sphingomonas profundi]
MNAGDAAEAATSALDWWRLAGVDMVAADTPRNWLARAAAPPPPMVSPAEPADSLPADLAALRLALAALPVAGAGEERLMPEGDPAAGLMLLLDMPDGDDALEGRLLAGPAGRLLDRMLGAIGRDRASVYLATILPARPAGGQLDRVDAAPAIRLAARHVALAAPRALLLCGDGATRALLGTSMLAARGRIHKINHDGGTVPAIATFHPCRLLEQPAQKAGAWADLRLLLGEFG